MFIGAKVVRGFLAEYEAVDDAERTADDLEHEPGR